MENPLSVNVAESFGLTEADELPAQWPVTVYPVLLNSSPIALPVSMFPGEDNFCMESAHDHGTLYNCTRRAGHTGRHFTCWWWSGFWRKDKMAHVRAVWGPKAVPVHVGEAVQ